MWDHAKISENSYLSDKKKLNSSSEREFPKLTRSGLSGPDNGGNRRGSTTFGSSCSARRASICRFYLVNMSSFCYLTS